MARKKLPSKKLPSIRSLIRKADRVFSAWIRHRDSGGHPEHFGRCVTCGAWGSHCGHYIKRQHLAARWDERNAALQCVRCNTYLGGNMDEYARFLISKYGPGILDELASLKRKVWKPTREELQAIIERYAK